MTSSNGSKSDRILARNRKALHDYFVIETWEAGIVLRGTEIKSLREGQASIAESWVKIKNNEAWLVGATIPPYSNAREDWVSHAPTRERKLLLRKKELTRISRQLTERLTLVPLDIHIGKRGFAKVKLALVKGKKSYDKRQTIKDRDLRRYGE